MKTDYIRRPSEGQELERFIPVAKQEIVEELLNDPGWKPEEQARFAEFAQLVGALYHYRYHALGEQLKTLYQPFNFDSDSVSRQEPGADRKIEMHRNLVGEMRRLLNGANYAELTVADINTMLNEQSTYGLAISIDLDDYAEMLLFYRGSVTNVANVRSWKYLWLAREVVETPIFQRLFLLLKFKDEHYRMRELMEQQGMSEKKALKRVRRSRKRLPPGIDADRIILKMFRNIPRSDLGVLFPNQHLRFKLFDKIQLAVTGGGSTVVGLWATVGKLIAAANPVALLVALGGFGGLLGRQVMKIFQKQNEYMMVLAQSLYFHNLNNNLGVITFLVDRAEEEEVKEALLAYFFLLRYPERKFNQRTLDEAVERFIAERYGVKVDFEVEDGVRKLREDRLVIEAEDGVLKAVPLDEACRRLDEEWDNFFQFANDTRAQEMARLMPKAS